MLYYMVKFIYCTILLYHYKYNRIDQCCITWLSLFIVPYYCTIINITELTNVVLHGYVYLLYHQEPMVV